MKILTLILGGALAGCGAAPDAATSGDPALLAAVSLPDLPDWTDRFADTNVGDVRFFAIEPLMHAHGLSRLDAVEVQNHYRDLTRATPAIDRGAAFAEALARVKGGDRESGLDPAALAAAPFIVVFDLDDTLWDQVRPGPGCGDVEFEGAGGKTRRIRMVPGWQDAIHRITALGGVVVLFSANLDDPTRDALAHITLDEAPLLGHPLIAGVLTNSYLVRQSKHEGPGAQSPHRGQPVLEGSKDLRLFDEGLTRVIIVDDNPTRLFQPANARLFKKFHGDVACAGEGAARVAYDRALKVVVDEIADAAAFGEGHGVPFAQAYLPYTIVGRVALDFLVEAGGLERDAAVAALREHPEWVDARL